VHNAVCDARHGQSHECHGAKAATATNPAIRWRYLGFVIRSPRAARVLTAGEDRGASAFSCGQAQPVRACRVDAIRHGIEVQYELPCARYAIWEVGTTSISGLEELAGDFVYIKEFPETNI
jgi:hypothetical protein